MSEPEDGFEEEPGVFDIEDDAAVEASTLRGIADLEAGRVISHEAVMRWLLSWGTPDELPPPKCGD
ncbi:MAG: CopG family transcriptional regulator [Phenylobacterium sp.]|uniref:CopG family transcriptional regulator n=1 Tax=Phenylobacterium sp. TaxID=1871053 RepID=UPI001A4398BA|nr:CopG family transcriptional regulator [Phenylobacterium sp.]MBL8771259.1 CopG family transcriptional regulator [Phenylobacterium sp.]